MKHISLASEALYWCSAVTAVFAVLAVGVGGTNHLQTAAVGFFAAIWLTLLAMSVDMAQEVYTDA